MCSIGVMFGSPEREVLKGFNEFQSHRGPDGSNIWMDEFCGFSHTRLAIVDVSGSNQPIKSDYGTVLVHNGEIYNFEKIKEDTKMYPWRTKGDSETILALYHKHSRKSTSIRVTSTLKKSGILVSKGFDSKENPATLHKGWVSKLDGIWGFALWDSKANELIISRDPMGVKPLIRATIGNSLLIASEAKAFSAHPDYNPQIDYAALNARLVYEYPLDRTTLLEGVTQVGAGVIETWSLDDSGMPVLTGICKYSDTKNNPSTEWDSQLDTQKLLDSFKSSLVDRLMSDVPLGIVLSGGLDSSLVAALAHDAAETAQKPVPECWTVADSEENPDWMAAELVANTFDLKHHQHIIEEKSFEKILPKLVWHGEDLDVTVLFFQPLFEKMSKHVKVGLCGQGADELHAGYPRYRELDKHANLIKNRLEQIDIKIDSKKIGLHAAWDDKKLMPEEHFSTLQKTLDFEMQRGQLTNFQLRLVDRHSMAHGLEVRVPFLGKSHWNSSRAIPFNRRLSPKATLGEEKLALRSAAKLTGLPKSIVNRPKLPAGKSTSPSLFRNFIKDYDSYIGPLIKRYEGQSRLLYNQPELAIGLGLFESLMIQQDKNSATNKNVDEILSNLI